MAGWTKNSGGNCWPAPRRISGCAAWRPRRPASTRSGSPMTWPRSGGGNTRWLEELLATRGWPGHTLVGTDGAEAAWLLAQHADRDPELQRSFLEALRGAVAAGEASRANLAYLEDRVRVHDGRPQLYGTQFTVTDGEFGPCPIEDPARLDERRAEVGLDPFAAYEELIRGQRTAEE